MKERERENMCHNILLKTVCSFGTCDKVYSSISSVPVFPRTPTTVSMSGNIIRWLYECHHDRAPTLGSLLIKWEVMTEFLKGFRSINGFFVLHIWSSGGLNAMQAIYLTCAVKKFQDFYRALGRLIPINFSLSAMFILLLCLSPFKHNGTTLNSNGLAFDLIIKGKSIIPKAHTVVLNGLLLY